MLPIIITIYILSWLIDFFTEPFMGIVRWVFTFYEQSGHRITYNHETLITFTSRICILILLFGFLLLLGFLGQKITKKVQIKIFSRIPFIPAIYRMSKEVTKALLKPGEKTFKESVLLPFPNKDSYALGLVTGDVLPAIKKKISHLDLAVFIPTAPHPLSGYILMTSKKEAISIDMTTEELFKFLLAAGAVNPEKTTKELFPK